MAKDDSLTFSGALMRKYFLPLTLGIVGLIFFIYGLSTLLAQEKETDVVVFDATEQSQTKSFSADDSAKKDVTIDIQGAVNKPGVYALSYTARVSDAVEKAGGFGQDVDWQWVTRELNQAAKVFDGMKLYIPRQGESFTPESLGSKIESININTASARVLEDLPGIGVVTAEKIIAGRPYQDIQELFERKILSKRTFERIKETISVY